MHKFINHGLEFVLNSPYILIDEKIIGLLNERDDVVDNEPIEEANNVHIW